MYYNDSSMSILIFISMLIFILETIGTYYRHEFLQKSLDENNEVTDARIYSSFGISKKKEYYQEKFARYPLKVLSALAANAIVART